MIDLDEKPESLNILGNIYHSFSKELSLPDYCYIDIKTESDVSIQVKKDIINSPSLNMHSFDDKVSRMLLTTVKLFEYLEGQGLAYFVGELESKSIGMKFSDENYVRCDFLEKESKALIYQYASKKIFVTESLKILASNEFKSEEVMRHEHTQVSTKKQLRYTQVALGLTFSGLLASIFLPMLSVTDINVKNTEFTTKLDKSTVDAFISNSKAISDQIKSQQKIIENETSKNTKQSSEIEAISQNLKELNGRVQDMQKAHNKANSLGRQKAPFVPHSAFWHR